MMHSPMGYAAWRFKSVRPPGLAHNIGDFEAFWEEIPLIRHSIREPMPAILIFGVPNPLQPPQKRSRYPCYTTRAERRSRAPQGASYDQNSEGPIRQWGTNPVGSH